MPVLLDGIADTANLPWMDAAMGVIAAGAGPAGQDCVEIGLVNNMPDSALQATERQFIGLLAAASGELTVRVHLLSLPAVVRGPAAAAHIGAIYSDIGALGTMPLDALIVTGCEPIAPSLVEEPYWDSLTRLIDWAEHNTVSTLWSCLAAHAAVLHLDGIGRRRLPAKRSGVYACGLLGGHPLLAGAPPALEVAHSRWNDLDEGDLREHGYEVLTRSPLAGVDMFVKQWRSLFVFFQGHPEYDLESIAREYRRDMARYLRGERDDYPSMPHGYFDAATEADLARLQDRALQDRTGVGLRDLPSQIALRPGLAGAWQASVLPVFRNWLDMLAARR